MAIPAKDPKHINVTRVPYSAQLGFVWWFGFETTSVDFCGFLAMWMSSRRQLARLNQQRHDDEDRQCRVSQMLQSHGATTASCDAIEAVFF